MKAMLILLVVFLLTACGASRREPTPTPTKTPTPMSLAAPVAIVETPTPATVTIEPPATATTAVQVATGDAAVDLVAAERLFRIFTLHVGTEVGLADSAAQVASGEADGMEGFGMLLALGAFLATADEGLNYDFGPTLAASAEVARQQQTALRDILRRWLDKEISSADVPGLLEQIDTEASALAYVEELKRLGIAPEEIDQMMLRMQEDMAQTESQPSAE